ncbi:MAG: nitroreductase family protein [Dysgonomonas sp.]
MSIPTTRAKEKAEIKIYEERCTGCGSCVSVCKDFSLTTEGGKVQINSTPIFGCIGCGHCMAICPTDAIEVSGREISPAEIYNLPKKEDACNYSQMLALFQRRRSVREFKDKAIDTDIIEQILAAAQTAPMGLPPSDVHVVVFDNKEKTRAFAHDFCEYLKNMKWFISDWFLSLMRPFWGKKNDEIFRGFVKPAMNNFMQFMDKGENIITYDAPLAMYFYASEYADPADPIVAATYAMISGESLGLGSCMVGSIHPMIQNGKKARKFREKYGIKNTCSQGLLVVFGYPAVVYKKGINRTFASVNRL